MIGHGQLITDANRTPFRVYRPGMTLPLAESGWMWPRPTADVSLRQTLGQESIHIYPGLRHPRWKLGWLHPGLS
jgi:hypothetical protein